MLRKPQPTRFERIEAIHSLYVNQLTKAGIPPKLIIQDGEFLLLMKPDIPFLMKNGYIDTTCIYCKYGLYRFMQKRMDKTISDYIAVYKPFLAIQKALSLIDSGIDHSPEGLSQTAFIELKKDYAKVHPNNVGAMIDLLAKYADQVTI